MDSAEITRQIMGAWDDVLAEEQGTDEVEQVTETPPEIEQPQEPEVEQPAEEEAEEEAEQEAPTEEEPEEEAEEEQEEGETEEEQEEEAEVTAYESDDLEVKAFLAKYGNDMEKALRGAAELSHVVGKQGMEKAQLQQRVEELENDLARARMLGGNPPVTDEQRVWIEQAVASGNPTYFVQQAVEAGEFELARALCAEWGSEDPYNAGRVRAQVDATEWEFANNQPPLDMNLLLQTMSQQDPEFSRYSPQMASVIERLGESHPAVQDARSGDLMRSINGLQRIYELARASSATVQQAREQVRAQEKEAAAKVRRNGVVSSASAAPQATETPRSRPLMPGLTLEDLEKEFAAQQ